MGDSGNVKKGEAISKAMMGKQNAFKHGAEGALSRRNAGKPFLGLAAEEERAVTAELQDAGISELVKRDAIRLQTVVNLYYAAVQKAAETGDIASFDRYVARLGWLAGVTLRAWQQVTANEKDAAKGNVITVRDVLKTIKGGDDESK